MDEEEVAAGGKDAEEGGEEDDIRFFNRFNIAQKTVAYYFGLLAMIDGTITSLTLAWSVTLTC